MRFRELCVLLPCHSLEDFPLHHAGDDADSLLACWTALWHPALLAAADLAPKWYRVDLPPEVLDDKLILVPTVSVSQLPDGFGERAKAAGAQLLRGERDRATIIGAAVAQLDIGDGGVDRELVADFLALGYTYLQVQILTRQMRYASNLDETHFFSQVLAGAKAAMAGQVDEARGKLASCFDLLGEERDHYYSVDAYLIDLTLVAETTWGAALRTELAAQTPINLLVAGHVASAMREREPTTHQAVVAALQQDQVGLVGGEFEEKRLPLISCEGILSEIRKGLQTSLDVFARRIDVYGRRSFGLSPFLPCVLEKLRFRGALHATLDDGHFPAATQLKTRWQGADGSVIDAIAKPPLDASQPETFLSFAQKLGGSMDTDHVATLCLAHWPGLACTWYEDLRRCARFTSALGKFVTVDRYFADTYLPGHLDRFEVDQYKSPYLRQDVIRKRPDPISSIANYWRHRVAAHCAEALAMLANVVSDKSASSDPQSALPSGTSPSDLVEHVGESETEQGLGQRIAAELDRQRDRLAERLPRQNQPTQPGCLVINPCSFARRLCVDVSQLAALPAVEKPVYASDEVNGRKYAVVDVPPMGFAWLTSGAERVRPMKAEPRLAEDARAREGVIWLRNEFIEASINPSTGGLQGFKDYNSRGNRLSQQLALRLGGTRGKPRDAWSDADDSANYSVMVADEVSVVTSSTALGEIVARGRLLRPDGQPVATFRQRWRLWRGSRVLQLEVELEPATEPASDPWNSYYACRFAWSDEMTELYQNLHELRQRVTKQRIEAPLFLELESGERRTTLLTGGLPYHRRVGLRMLDSLIAVRGEQTRTYQMGIGLDLSQPLPEALGLLAPSTVLFQTASPPTPASCWLFHVDARSVVATHWSVLSEGDKVVGVRVRLLESAGRPARARLSAFRPFTSARHVNFLGDPLGDLPRDQGRIVMDLAAHEWMELEARW